MGGKYLRMRCAAHLLNLIVKDGIDEIKPSIAAIRNSISYIRSSPSRLQMLRKCFEKEKVQFECLLSLEWTTLQGEIPPF